MASGLKGKLTVHLHKAIDLKDVQTFGKQDPYCQIYVGQEQYKTRVANDAGTTPVWEQAFLFNLTGVEDAIHIKINDRESLIDRPIGRVDIPLQELCIKASKGPAWFQVHDVNNFQIKAGQIYISVEFTGTGLVSSNTAHAAAPTSAPVTTSAHVPVPIPVPVPVQQRPIQQAAPQQYQALPQQYQPPPQQYQPPPQTVYHQPLPQSIYQQQPQPQPVYHAPPLQQPLYQPPPAYASPPQLVQPVIYQPPPQQYTPQPVVHQQPVMYQQQAPVQPQPVVYPPQPVLQPPIMQTYIPPVNPYAHPGTR